MASPETSCVRRVAFVRAFLVLCMAVALSVAGLLHASLAWASVLPDGEYDVAVTLEGGSGRASVESPCDVVVSGGEAVATIVWSSPNYDLMVVDGQEYVPLNEEGNSSFLIPVRAFDEALAVSAETTAMSEPHMIDYTLRFDSSSAERAGRGTSFNPAMFAVAIVLAGVIALLAARMRRRDQVLP